MFKVLIALGICLPIATSVEAQNSKRKKSAKTGIEESRTDASRSKKKKKPASRSVDAERELASEGAERDVSEDAERNVSEDAERDVSAEESPMVTEFHSFCAVDDKLPAGTWVKKKLVIFPLEVGKGVKVTMGKEDLVRSEAAGIFQLNYPMQRYRALMVSSKQVVQELKKEISFDTLKSAMNPVEMMELGCAEYAIIPLVSDFKSEKKKVESVDKKTGQTRVSEAWTVKLTIEAGVYQRDGQKGLRLKETINATAPSALDLFSDIGQAMAQQVKGAVNQALPKYDIVDVLKAHEHVSSVPAEILSGCADEAKKKLSDAFSGKPDLKLRKCSMKNLDIKKSDLYQAANKQNELKKCLESPPSNLDEQYLCELRNRTQQAALSLQLETRGLDDFRLYGPLARTKSRLETPLGLDEGVGINDEFFIIEKRPGKKPRELGLVKIYEPGPGGVKGLKVASKLQLISGNAKKSSPYITVEENPRRGVDVTLDTGLVPFAVPAMTLPNLAQDKVAAGAFAPAVGAGIGFDLSKLTGIPEIYEKTNMYYVMREPFSSFLIHTGAEKRWLIADSTYASAAILAAASMVSFKTGNVSEETQTVTTTNGETGESQSSSQDVKKEEEASAQTYGTILQGGFSYRLGKLSSIGLQGGYQYMGDKLSQFKADSGDSVLRDTDGNIAAIDLSGGFLMLDFYLHL